MVDAHGTSGIARDCAPSLMRDLYHGNQIGLGHDTIPWLVTGIDDGAMPDILSWIASRFAGQPAPSTCGP